MNNAQRIMNMSTKKKSSAGKRTKKKKEIMKTIKEEKIDNEQRNLMHNDELVEGITVANKSVEATEKKQKEFSNIYLINCKSDKVLQGYEAINKFSKSFKFGVMNNLSFLGRKHSKEKTTLKDINIDLFNDAIKNQKTANPIEDSSSYLLTSLYNDNEY